MWLWVKTLGTRFYPFVIFVDYYHHPKSLFQRLFGCSPGGFELIAMWTTPTPPMIAFHPPAFLWGASHQWVVLASRRTAGQPPCLLNPSTVKKRSPESREGGYHRFFVNFWDEDTLKHLLWDLKKGPKLQWMSWDCFTLSRERYRKYYQLCSSKVKLWQRISRCFAAPPELASFPAIVTVQISIAGALVLFGWDRFWHFMAFDFVKSVGVVGNFWASRGPHGRVVCNDQL